MENKKYLIVLILRILETASDSEHPLSQVKIAEMIGGIYPCDRKTVGRNIAFLKKVGYPILKNSKGYYMDKMLFTRAEIDFVLDAVRKRDAETLDKESLCERLYQSLTRYYKK